MKEEIPAPFQNDAKGIVDLIFDNKMFNEQVTRDNMNAFEDLIAFLIHSRYESHCRMYKLLNNIDKPKK